MDQFDGLAVSSTIFFSYIAYSEARDFLQTISPNLSMLHLRLVGMLAAASTLALCIVAGQSLVSN